MVLAFEKVPFVQVSLTARSDEVTTALDDIERGNKLGNSGKDAV